MNESAFRAVNERLETLAAGFSESPEFVCECADATCAQRLRIPLDEYERVRAHGDRFVVAPGHERLRYERVIDARPDWLVVEKTGEAGDVASEADPRSEEQA